MLLSNPLSRFLAAWVLAVAILLAGHGRAGEPLLRALAMHGQAAFPDGPDGPFPWVDTNAPKG